MPPLLSDRCIKDRWDYVDMNSSNTLTGPDTKEKNKRKAKNVPMFVILGKPSVGKSKLAQRLCDIWNCEYVNATKLICDNLSKKTPVGIMLWNIMKTGRDLDDETVFKLTMDKLDSPECSENGYILDDFPTYSQKERTILNQLNSLMLLANRTNCFIHIKVPDEKHKSWWEKRRIDPETGGMYELVISPNDGEGQLIALPVLQTHQPGDIPQGDADLQSRLLTRHEELPHCLNEHMTFHNQVVLPAFQRFFDSLEGVPLVTLEGCAEHSALFESTIMALYDCSDKTTLGSLDLFGELTDEEANDKDKDMDTLNRQKNSKSKGGKGLNCASKRRC